MDWSWFELREHGCIKQSALDLLGLFADAEAADAEMADALCAAAEDDEHDQEQLPDAAAEPGHEPGAGSPPGTSNQQAAATPMVMDCSILECLFTDYPVLELLVMPQPHALNWCKSHTGP